MINGEAQIVDPLVHDLRRHRWLVGAILLMVAALFWAAHLEATRLASARMDVFRSDVQDKATLAQTIVKSRLKAYDAALLELRNIYANEPAQFEKRLQAMRQGTLADGEALIVVVDRDGQLAFTDSQNPNPQLDQRKRAAFRYFADGGMDRLYIDEPVFGSVTRRHALPLARPIYDRQGRFQGVLALSVKQDSLASFDSSLQFSSVTTVSVVTETGAVVSRSSDFDKVQGTRITSQRLAKLLQGDAGVFSDQSSVGSGERIIAFRHLEGIPLIVYASDSPNEVLAVASQQRILLMSGAGLVSVLVLLLGAAYLRHEKSTQKYIDAQQAHLSQREHGYYTMFESAPEGIWVVGPDRRTTQVNQKMCELLGYMPEELLGLDPVELADEENGKIFEANRRLVPSSTTRVYEVALRHRDGHNIPTEFRATNLFNDDGAVLGVMAFVTDLTERKQHQMEQLLLTSRAAALLNLHAASEKQDERAVLQFALDTVEQLTGSQIAFAHFVADNQQDLEQSSWSKATAEHDATAHANLWADALRQRTPMLVNDCAESGRLLCVPVVDSGLVRMLVGAAGKPQPYTPFDLETTRLVAETVWRIIAQQRADAALRTSEATLMEAQYVAGMGSYVLDVATGRWESSQALDSLFGIDKEYERSVLGWEDLIHREDRDMMDAYFRDEVVGERVAFNKEYRITRYDDATERWVRGLGKLEFDERGLPCKMRGTIQDITEVKQAEDAMRRTEERYRTVFLTSPDGIIVNRLADGLYLDFNDGFLRLVGLTRTDVLGKTLRDINIWSHRDGQRRLMQALQGDDYFENLEINFNAANGKAITALMSAHVTALDGVPCLLSVIRDITERKKVEEELKRVAHFDALTNLPNRVLLADRLQQAMLQCQRRGQRVAVVFLDLDGFKSVNDHHGHEVGDQLLIGLAASMKQALREGDTLARLGGDEFVAVLPDLADIDACSPMLTRLLAAASQPVQAGELVVQVSASVGVTFYPQAQDMDADQVLRQADHAMYQAKLSGKSCFHVFDADEDRSVRGHHESLTRIRQALDEHEFILYYQPKVHMRTGQIVGVEALIRWQHPELGLLAPADFLPDIEDHLMAVAVGEWVIDAALTQLELWSAAGIHTLVSVNVGARQLQQHDFVDRLRGVLMAHPRVSPAQLEIEILETSALEDVAQVSRVIENCAELGVTFALDDFGTGYSSLSYLKRLQVRQLKIDKSFVCDLFGDPDDLAILEGVISMASAFKREVIAEGVETVAHGTLLLRLGCELAQGFGIAAPMPGADLPAWMAAWRPDPAWLDERDPLARIVKVQKRAMTGALRRFEHETSPP